MARSGLGSSSSWGRFFRVLVSVGFGSGVLFLGALAGGAFQPLQAAPKGKPPRPVQEYANAMPGEIAVGDALVVSGQPMQLSLFYTGDQPGKVIDFYLQAFRARGMMPIASGEASMAHVSAFDPRDGMQRFISAVPQPGGQTLVMVGVTNPRTPPKLLRGAQAAGFPVPSENRAFLGFQSEDQGTHAESAQFVSSLAPVEVGAFYRAELGKLGWSERKADSTESFVMFEKGSSTLSVALQKLDEKKGAAVFVNRVEGGAQ